MTNLTLTGCHLVGDVGVYDCATPRATCIANDTEPRSHNPTVDRTGPTGGRRPVCPVPDRLDGLGVGGCRRSCRPGGRRRQRHGRGRGVEHKCVLWETLRWRRFTPDVRRVDGLCPVRPGPCSVHCRCLANRDLLTERPGCRCEHCAASF